MGIPTYVPGYPPDGSSLGQTKSTIRNNLDGTFETLGVDHVNNNGVPGSQPPGYHTIIHGVPQSSVSTVANYNQVFAGVPGTLIVNGTTTPAIPPDGLTHLYSLNSGGGLYQLTGAVGNTNGYCWAGGLLFQWGIRNLTGAQVERATILFNTANVNFPVAVFSMQISLICKAGGTSSSENTISIVNNSITTTSFQYQYNGSGGGNYPALFWLAIGR
jgi:hypothetical protein